MHHVHISGFALLLGVLFGFGIGSLILAYLRSLAAERRFNAQVELERERLRHIPQSGGPGVTREGRWDTPYRDGGVIYSSPAVSPVVAVAPMFYDPLYIGAEAALVGAAIAETAIIESTALGMDTFDSGIDIGGGYDSGGYSDGGIDFSFD